MTQVVFSTLPFIHLHPLDAVELCLANGAEKVEIFMEGPHWSTMTDKQRHNLSENLNQLPCAYSVHPPQFDLNLASNWPLVRQAAFETYREAVHFAGMIHASHIVIDPGHRHLSLTSRKEARETARHGLENLLAEAEKSNVSIGIENGPAARKSLFNEEEYIEFVESFNHPMIGAVLDTGHARLAGWESNHLIRKLTDKLLALHLNDTSGRVDNHLSLNKGVIKWESIFYELRQLKTLPDLVLELNTQTEMKEILQSKAFILSLLMEE